MSAYPVDPKTRQDPKANLVNATAVAGNMQGNGCGLVFDINYGRRDNIWQALAQRCEIPFIDGLSGLAYQARRTFLL